MDPMTPATLATSHSASPAHSANPAIGLDAPIEPVRLKCLEVFGGNRAERREVSVPGVDAVVHAEPHDQQGGSGSGGGDVHYISQCMAGAISRFVVADVAGHGVDVNEIALALRRLMRKHINTPDQSRLTRAINEEFSRVSESSGRFATAVLATYFAPTSSLILSNAGHPPPLIRRAGERGWMPLTPDAPGVRAGRDHEADDHFDPSDLPLGVIEPTGYAQFATPIRRGDAVVLYTDSWIEATDSAGRQLGVRGLAERLSRIGATDPHDLADAAIASLHEHRAGPAEDDVTLMVLVHNGAPPPRQSLGEWVSTLGRMVTGR